MQKRNLIAIILTLLIFATAVSPAWGSGCAESAYGISTLRGDAQYPPWWDKMGGSLDIRHPFVRLHCDSDGVFIKGFEFEVKNTSTSGEDHVFNGLMDGVLSMVYIYLIPGTNIRMLGLITPDHIFAKGGTDPYVVQSPGEINTDYVRLTADIPQGLYIPGGAGNLTLMVIYKGSFENEITVPLAMGGYAFDPVRDSSTRIVFSHMADRYAVSNLAMVLPDGDDRRELTSVPNITNETYTGYFEPAWNADGTRLVFRRKHCSERVADPIVPGVYQCSQQKKQFNDLYIVDLSDGAFDAEQPVTVVTYPVDNYPDPQEDWINCDDCPGAYLYSPSFSPDGNHVVCTIHPPAWAYADRLAVFDIASGKGDYINGYENIDLAPGPQLFPVWSPDGQTIAYYKDSRFDEVYEDSDDNYIYYNRHIYSLEPQITYADGSDKPVIGEANHINLTPGPDEDVLFYTDPGWSPDSQWLVFASDRDGDGITDIWIMDRNGNNPHKIYEGDTHCYTPRFSPDGTRIAFQSGRSLYTIDLGGRNLHLVATREDEDSLAHRIDWSPFLDDYTPTVALTAERLDTGGYTLTWTSTDAEKLVMNNEIGELADLSGSMNVEPGEDTDYTITAYNLFGRATAGVRLKAGAP